LVTNVEGHRHTGIDGGWIGQRPMTKTARRMRYERARSHVGDLAAHRRLLHRIDVRLSRVSHCRAAQKPTVAPVIRAGLRLWLDIDRSSASEVSPGNSRLPGGSIARKFS
jgi:hypothetical protein